MKINVNKLEKRLTKGMVTQMEIADSNVLQNGEVLGYLINVRKGYHKLMLLQYEGDYYIEHIGWHDTDRDMVSMPAQGRGFRTKTFDSLDMKVAWVVGYKRAVKLATDHIYI